MKAYREELKKRIEENKDEIIEVIRQGIQIPSVKGEPVEGSPYGADMIKILEFALNLGKKWGFRTKNVDGRAGWMEIGEGEEMVAILGHLDVVPEGEGWTYPPYAAEIHDGKLYGRGVVDDKGPVIGAMYTLKLIKEMGIPLKKRIRIIFGLDEENGSSCIRHYIECGEEAPTAGFTPDAEFPVIFFEKGIINFKIGKNKIDSGKGIVKSMKAGIARNIVPPKCILTGDERLKAEPDDKTIVKEENGEVTITALGKDAHGSTPELGENAIINMISKIQDFDFGGDFQNLAGFIKNKMNMEGDGKKLGIYYEDEETGKTTVNLGMLEYSEEQMHLELDIRFPKNGNFDAITEKVSEAAKEYGMEILEEERTDMLYVSPKSELVQKLMKVYQDETNDKSEALAIGGGTYAKMFPNMVAFGPIFDGEGTSIHCPDENTDIESLMKGITISTLGILALATE